MRYGPGGTQLNTIEDFWNKVDIREENDCWNWLEGRWQNGYGRYKYHYKSWRAHRFALIISGKVPEEFEGIVRHLCHNRKCCNPKHLAWGTHQDNMNDAKAFRRGLFVAEYEAGLPQ